MSTPRCPSTATARSPGPWAPRLSMHSTYQDSPAPGSASAPAFARGAAHARQIWAISLSLGTDNVCPQRL
eukprot:2116261-Prymnesium_polylepis.1